MHFAYFPCDKNFPSTFLPPFPLDKTQFYRYVSSEKLHFADKTTLLPLLLLIKLHHFHFSYLQIHFFHFSCDKTIEPIFLLIKTKSHSRHSHQSGTFLFAARLQKHKKIQTNKKQKKNTKTVWAISL